jgi:hypothetical protein
MRDRRWKKGGGSSLLRTRVSFCKCGLLGGSIRREVRSRTLCSIAPRNACARLTWPCMGCTEVRSGPTGRGRRSNASRRSCALGQPSLRQARAPSSERAVEQQYEADERR